MEELGTHRSVKIEPFEKRRDMGRARTKAGVAFWFVVGGHIVNEA